MELILAISTSGSGLITHCTHTSTAVLPRLQTHVGNEDGYNHKPSGPPDAAALVMQHAIINASILNTTFYSSEPADSLHLLERGVALAMSKAAGCRCNVKRSSERGAERDVWAKTEWTTNHLLNKTKLSLCVASVTGKYEWAVCRMNVRLTTPKSDFALR